MKKRGRPAKVQNVVHVPSLIDFGQITLLNQLNIDRRMLESMETESEVIKGDLETAIITYLEENV